MFYELGSFFSWHLNIVMASLENIDVGLLSVCEIKL